MNSGAMEGWPFPSDFRDPSEAWDLQGKVLFFALYTGFWSCVVLAVFLYTRLRSRCSCRRRARSPVKRQSNGFGDVSKMSEAFGEMPPFPERKVHELFLEQAKLTPTATALVLPHEAKTVVTYQELAEAVRQLAVVLERLGANGEIVALSLPRSSAQVVSILGALLAGAGYLPMDDTGPEARKRLVLEDSRAKVLISDANSQECKQLAADLGLHWVAISSFGNFTVTEAQRPAVQSGAGSGDTGDVAMLIYTSGSTGEPKGIVYDHQHLLHGAWFWAEEHGMSESSVQLFKSPYFWAVMEWEVFPALIRGGKLVVASADGHKSPQYMAQTIEKFHVDVLMITPSVLDLLLDVAQGSLRGLRVITTVGEPLTSQLANRVASHRGLSVTLRNFYGASESSCTVYTVPEHGVDTALYPRYVPAGTPQPHVSVFILAEGSFELMPPGEAGEICFGGVLAARYWQRPELTDAKFVPTEDFGRIYRTGDLGRFREGALEVVGRLDRQLKVNGVRVEPGEIEAVLMKFEPQETQQEDAEMGCLLPVAKAAVCCADPPQLVAFVEPRKEATIRAHELMEHCRKELMPAYLPKLIVVLDAGLPVLPNGKVNYKSLKEMADKEASQAQETVMDSLGQMKSMSRAAILENAVIHRCYAFWMLGVLTDHYAWCAMSTDPKDPTGMRSLPFCTALASWNVAPWAEALVRSLGNDQDLFGFIMLGAYQDSRPQGGEARKRARLGWPDLFVFAVYLFMAMPLPQIFRGITGGWAYPDRTWQTFNVTQGTNGWDQVYMQNSDATAGHRWYLQMILCAKLYLVICDSLCLPPFLQVLVAALGSFFGPVNAGNACQAGVPSFAVYWLLGGCFAWIRWVACYGAFYVFCFHYLRSIVKFFTGRLPSGPVWSASATASSMLLGLLMALFHYPNQLLESGEKGFWLTPILEVAVTTLQPALFALGTVYWPVKASFWGNSTLGCYVIHFLFRDRMTEVIQMMIPMLSWDLTGLLLPWAIVVLCLAFMSTVGPVGHYILIAPQFLASFVRRRLCRKS
ncbi:tycC [Symbiodinium sp. CCMP2592]|nr:tycC [Symbiodinium sp. CCMP2592]